MNDEILNRAAARMEDALKATQAQTQDAAAQLGGLLRFGARKLKQVADTAADAIGEDLRNR